MVTGCRQLHFLIYNVRMTKFALYVDESGTPGLVDSRSHYFVLTGLAIEENVDIKLSGYFELVKRRFGIFDGQGFHSVDLFEKTDSPQYLTDKRARELAKSLSEFIENCPLNILVCALDKDRLRNHFGVPKDTPSKTFKKSEIGTITRDVAYDILASKIFFWFASTILRNKTSRGSIIAESRDSSDKALLTAFLDCKEPGRYRQNLKTVAAKTAMVKEKITSIKFENKIAERPGLEISDLISYVCNLRLCSRLTSFEERGIPKLWNAIKQNIEKNQIDLVQGNGFEKFLPASRVHKISNFCRNISS